MIKAFQKNHNISFSKIKQNEKVCFTGQKTEEQKDQPKIKFHKKNENYFFILSLFFLNHFNAPEKIIQNQFEKISLLSIKKHKKHLRINILEQ